MKNNFYDRKNDILSLHNGFSKNEKFNTNIEVGNIIVDLSNKNKVIGVEIMDATDVFTFSELENFSCMDFEASINGNWINIKIIMNKLSEKTISIPIKAEAIIN